MRTLKRSVAAQPSLLPPRSPAFWEHRVFQESLEAHLTRGSFPFSVLARFTHIPFCSHVRTRSHSVHSFVIPFFLRFAHLPCVLFVAQSCCHPPGCHNSPSLSRCWRSPPKLLIPLGPPPRVAAREAAERGHSNLLVPLPQPLEQ